MPCTAATTSRQSSGSSCSASAVEPTMSVNRKIGRASCRGRGEIGVQTCALPFSLNHVARHAMHGGDDFTPVFRVELFGQRGRADDVGEQDGHYAPLFGGRGWGCLLRFERGELLAQRGERGSDDGVP